MQFYVSLVVAFVCCAASVSGAQVTEPIRRIPYSPNQTIAERLLDSDETVVITMSRDDVVTPSRPSAQQMARELLRQYTALIVRITDVEGVFVDGGKWIDSKLTGEVTEVLREQRQRTGGTFRKGEPASVSMYGGSRRIGRVLAKTDRSVEVSEGQAYVVFVGDLDLSQQLPRVMHPPLAIQANGRLHAPTGAVSDLEGLTLTRLKRLARSR